MGFRVRKSFGSGPLRVNVSKSGVGFSAGAKGLRVTKKAGGGTRTTASIPGTGMSYVNETKGKKSGKKPAGCLSAVVTFCLVFFGVGLLFNSCGSNDSDGKTAPSSSQSPAASQSSMIHVQTDAANEVIETLIGLGFEADALESEDGRVKANAYMEGLDAASRPDDWAEKRALIVDTTLLLKEKLGKSVLIYLKDDQNAIYLTVTDGSITWDVFPDKDVSAEPSESVEPAEDPSPSASVSVAPRPSSSEEMVWIPKTGKRYHNNPECSGMRNPSLVTLSEAISRKYGPCNDCY